MSGENLQPFFIPRFETTINRLLSPTKKGPVNHPSEQVKRIQRYMCM